MSRPLKLSFWVYGRKALDVSKRYNELLEKVLEEHEHKRLLLSCGNGNGDDESERGLVDILLDVYHDPHHAEFKITRTHILAFFMDLFIAGSDTSAEAMQWAMAELLNHPEAFQKVRKEIERPVTTRECRQHCQINGFDVPPNTAVAINLYAIMRDPDSWDNPNEFCPERFLHEDLSDDGKMKFNFVPFGGGRRGYPGTTLAFSLMNTAVAATVQCFDWKIGEDGKGQKVDMQSGSGMSFSMLQPPYLCSPSTF
ncbi:hypothetical protein VNO78_06782 [Psophocarpus tetragonolobus]|uniref:Cytochrome P450 n=1 Tax=Psophocarpus tetragonolobus TaxID=3891 RepID=A0AAN9SVK3_PSOTE